MRTLIFFTLLFSQTAWSQTQIDTVYFDKHWDKCSADTFTFLRLIQPEKVHFWVRDFYKDRHLQMSGTYTSLDPEVEDGKFMYYNDAGVKWSERNYRNGKKEGEYKTYDSAGALKSDAMYTNDERNGKYIKYYPDGKVRRKEEYRNGKMTAGQCYDTSGTELPFFPESVRAMFPGGDTAMFDFIRTHTKYPKAAIKFHVEGKVKVRFIINKDGTIGNIQIDKSDQEVFNEAAMDVVRQMPKWIPGMEEGQPAVNAMVLPIKFTLP